MYIFIIEPNNKCHHSSYCNMTNVVTVVTAVR